MSDTSAQEPRQTVTGVDSEDPGSTGGAMTVPGYVAGTWKADPAHSEIAFTVRHLMISKARGRFTDYDVTITTTEDLVDSSVTATIVLASISTGNDQRDKHLRSSDYLDTDTHPTMSYRSTGIRHIDDSWFIDGNLTLHGHTRHVPMAVEFNGFGPDQFGGHRAGFSATAQISRRDFGIDLSVALDGGGVAVGDKVAISIEIEAVLQPKP
jgi:polyisoprenoid-binding protein YceI